MKKHLQNEKIRNFFLKCFGMNKCVTFLSFFKYIFFKAANVFWEWSLKKRMQKVLAVMIKLWNVKKLLESCILTHYNPMLLFYIPWKHHLRFFDVFRGYRKATPGCNGLIITFPQVISTILIKFLGGRVYFWIFWNCPSKTRAISKFSKSTRVIYPKNCPNQICDYWLITSNQEKLCIETNIF